MTTHVLPYAEITILCDDIAEIVIKQGMEIDAGALIHMSGFLRNNLKTPFGLLYNKINSYAYTFEAQRMMKAPDGLNAAAVVAYNIAGEQSAKYITNISKPAIKNIFFSYDYDKALQWLEEQQNIVRQTGNNR